MKLHVLLIGLLLAVSACNNEPENSENVQQAGADSGYENLPVVDGHNAQNALDVFGSYTGTLPCADCEGIETTVTLNSDSSYVLFEKYKGKGDGNTREEKGRWEWVTDSYIVLNGVIDRPAMYSVEENRLRQLSMEGTKIDGDLAELYILKKQP